jgi:Flp pilus assembly protein TadD
MTALANQQSLDQARRYHQAGKIEEAETLYREILRAQPDHPEVMGLLGLAVCQLGRPGEAIEWIERAIALEPGRASFHCNLGMALAAAGRQPEAVAAHRRAIKLFPKFAEAWVNLGSAYAAMGEWELAREALEQALEARPGFELAERHREIAVEKGQDLQRVIAACRQDIAARRDDAELYYRLADTLEMDGQFFEAEEIWRQTIGRWPEDAKAHWKYGSALLRRGEYLRGWEEHEWRLRVEEFAQNRKPLGEERKWDGKDLGGKRILIYPEQGFGDIIFFARYAKLVAQRGGKVVLQCPNELLRVFETLEGVDELVGWGRGVPEFEVQCSIASLPAVMKLGMPEDVPWRGGYLRNVQKNRSDLIERGKGKAKVGLVWSGGATPPDRLVPLKMFAPLGKKGIVFYGLQYGGSEEAKSPPAGMELIDASGVIRDFADTAALISEMDLVISMDAAAANLAGAMGAEAWVMVKRAADWRWGMEGEKSAWYPTVRIFRQRRSGAWFSVIEKMGEALESWLAKRED